MGKKIALAILLLLFAVQLEHLAVMSEDFDAIIPTFVSFLAIFLALEINRINQPPVYISAGKPAKKPREEPVVEAVIENPPVVIEPEVEPPPKKIIGNMSIEEALSQRAFDEK